MTFRALTLAAAALLAIGLVAPSVEAAPLPIGTWGCAANGFNGSLVVSSVSGAGVLSATFLGSPVIGGYDSNTNRITLTRQGSGDRNTDQISVGYLFAIPNSPTSGQTSSFLTGYFIAYPGTGGTAARPEYGWACGITQ